MNIGIFIFEGVEELDFVGPYEVLTSWARQTEDARLDSTDRAEWVRRYMQYETPLYVS